MSNEPVHFYEVLSNELDKIKQRRAKNDLSVRGDDVNTSLDDWTRPFRTAKEAIEGAEKRLEERSPEANEKELADLMEHRNAVGEAAKREADASPRWKLWRERVGTWLKWPPPWRVEPSCDAKTTNDGEFLVLQRAREKALEKARGELRHLEVEATRELQRKALELKGVGLALSGGGVRSASFNLGVLQGLAELRMLQLFDYLSTVSGGGYVGGWLAAWIKRQGDVGKVEQQLDPNRERQSGGRGALFGGTVLDEEPEPVYHLRSYSSYLAPVQGLFSADSWTLIGIYLRNLLINLLMLVPAVVALVLVCRLLIVAFHGKGGAGPWEWEAYGALATFALAAVTFHLNLRRHFQRAQQPEPGLWELGDRQFAWLYRLLSRPAEPGGEKDVRLARGAVLRALDFFLFLPLLLGVVLACSLGTSGWNVPDWLRTPGLPPALQAAVAVVILHGVLRAVFAVLAAVRHRLSVFLRGRRAVPGSLDGSRVRGWAAWGRAILCGFVSGGLVGLLGYSLFIHVLYPLRETPEAVLTVGPPLGLLVFVVGLVAELAVLGRVLDEAAREWWGAVAGRLLRLACAWAVLFGTLIYGSWLVVRAYHLAGNVAIPAGMVLTWLTTAVGGALAGRSPRTANGLGNPWLERLAKVGPPVFVVGLLAFAALAGNWTFDRIAPAAEAPAGDYLAGLRQGSPLDLVVGIVLSLGLLVVMLVLIDVNTFSAHAAYANRLIRCYLGASRRKPLFRWLNGRGGAPTGVTPDKERQEDPLTAFDNDDDILLSDLKIGKDHSESDGRGGRREVQKTYWGPLPILNSALNLVAGDELAWQERKAEAFVLTPEYCGSKSTGYREVPDFKLDGPPAEQCYLTLGRAMAISGAAASPNMGYHSSPALTFLMTVFNVRLGWWMRNPRRPGPWLAESPSFGTRLFQELLGRTDERGLDVYLSDGGHFDNLGVYELVRRRCRYVIACDASADPGYEFTDLGSLIRLVRDDFGIRIVIDVAPLRRTAGGNRSRWHCAVGLIHYEDVDLGAAPGVFVYLKASLTGDEPSDVLTYAEHASDFPHQSTADQFFTESQFESYRALGHHVVIGVLRGVVAEHGCSDAARLFSALRQRWFPPPPDLEKNFLASTRAFLDVQRALRQDKHLRGLSFDLYPELGSEPPPGLPAAAGASDGTSAPRTSPRALTSREAKRAGQQADRERAGLHAVLQMLQVMENAWLGVQLGEYHDHPLNRGWMNVFRRWTNSELFSQHWPTVRGEFSQGFVNFCEKELRLIVYKEPEGLRRVAKPVSRMTPDSDAVDRRVLTAYADLGDEFDFEWWAEAEKGGGLTGLIRRAERVIVDEKTGEPREGQKPPIWIVWLTPASKEGGGVADFLADYKAPAGGGAPRGRGESDERPPDGGAYPCGIVLAYRAEGAATITYELLVWLRGAYRSVGIGRKCLSVAWFENKFCRELRELHPGKSVTFSVRYPAEGEGKAGELLEKEIWSAFFSYYGFRKPGGMERGRDLTMMRTFGPLVSPAANTPPNATSEDPPKVKPRTHRKRRR